MNKKRKFKHLDQYDRDRIEALLRKGHKKVEIARILKIDKSTVSREINKRKRKNGIYDADTAQHKARTKRLLSKFQGMRVESNNELKEYIIINLKQLRSPDEIAGRMEQEKKPFDASKKAIYKWLYSVYGQKYCRYLCTRRYRPREQKDDKFKRVMIPDKISITERPSNIQLNHFEGDTMLSPKKIKVKTSVSVACSIEAKYMCGAKIKNLKPQSMKNAVRGFDNQLHIDTMTLDSGIENRSHKEFGMPTYFCDPHSPWQKPHIENAIGLMRRWFLPKGTDLSKVTEKELQKYILILNHKYRKSLNYRSAYEVALERGILKREINQKVAIEGRI